MAQPVHARSSEQADAPSSSLDAPTFPLPNGWVPTRDLVVLVGADLAGLARWFVAEGHTRVLLLDPDAPDAPEAQAARLPEPGQVVRTEADLLQAILRFPGAVPARVVLRAGREAHATGERMRALGERLGDCLRSKALLLHTVVQQGRTSLVQGLANLGNLARFPSIAGLGDTFRGKPAVLVSPGPSLSKNIHLLREVKGRALLITGTHALASFARAGVAPDLVLAADPGDLARHWQDYDLSKVEAFLAAATCRPECFAQAAPRTLSFAGNGEIDDWLYEPLGEDARLATGGSVACSAFSLALRLGCDPIVLVGQDLSFPDGRYYCAESLDGDAGVIVKADGTFRLEKPEETTDEYGAGRTPDGRLLFARDRPTVEVAGYHGGTVRSSEAFRAFLFWFETVIEAQAGERRIWNATEGGARIAGAEPCTLAEALARFDGELAPGRVLDEALGTPSPEERASRLRAHFERTLEGLDTCSELAAACRAKLPAALGDAHARKAFEELEQRMRAAVRPLTCLPLVAQGEIQAALEAAHAATDLRGNLAASGKLFDVFDAAANFVRGPIRAALAGLEKSA